MMGLLLTRITELATVVYVSDEIQAAKWAASANPEAPKSQRSSAGNSRQPARLGRQANGASNTPASTNRHAPTASGGAWARRISTEAKEAARMPAARIGHPSRSPLCGVESAHRLMARFYARP